MSTIKRLGSWLWGWVVMPAGLVSLGFVLGARADDSPIPVPDLDNPGRRWTLQLSDRCLSLASQPLADTCPPPGSHGHDLCPCDEQEAPDDPEPRRGEL